MTYVYGLEYVWRILETDIKKEMLLLFTKTSLWVVPKVGLEPTQA